jgi:hypothetical protein
MSYALRDRKGIDCAERLVQAFGICDGGWENALAADFDEIKAGL